MDYKTRDTQEKDETHTGEGPEFRLLGTDALIGNDVYNHTNEELGGITEIMLDVNTGNIAYAVLSFRGFLGITKKLFAVPWSALELHTENQRFLLDMDKAQLEVAPGFNKDEWPDMADPNWKKTITTTYKPEPYSKITLDETSTYIDEQ